MVDWAMTQIQHGCGIVRSFLGGVYDQQRNAQLLQLFCRKIAQSRKVLDQAVQSLRLQTLRLHIGRVKREYLSFSLILNECFIMHTPN